MALVLSILSLGSIFLGFFFKEIFTGLGSDFFNFSIFVMPEHNLLFGPELMGYMPEVEDEYEVVLEQELFPGVTTQQIAIHLDFKGRVPI